MKRIYDSGPTFSLLKEAVQECISSAGASGSVSNEASVLLTIAVDALLKVHAGQFARNSSCDPCVLGVSPADGVT